MRFMISSPRLRCLQSAGTWWICRSLNEGASAKSTEPETLSKNAGRDYAQAPNASSHARQDLQVIVVTRARTTGSAALRQIPARYRAAGWPGGRDVRDLGLRGARGRPRVAPGVPSGHVQADRGQPQRAQELPGKAEPQAAW